MKNKERVKELFTKNREMEKKIIENEELILETQHKLYGIQSVITAMIKGSYNDRINLETFRSGTGVALDSLNAILQSIKKTL